MFTKHYSKEMFKSYVQKVRDQYELEEARQKDIDDKQKEKEEMEKQ